MERISWTDFFMGVAQLSAKRSKDPHTQVGACIVRDKKILSTGYNGMPRACNDKMLPLGNTGKWLDTKYPYIVHAEVNAILNATTSLAGATLYTTLFPCSDCAKAILQAGITTIFYLEDKHPNEDTFIAAKRLFKLAGTNVIQIKELNCKTETQEDLRLSLERAHSYLLKARNDYLVKENESLKQQIVDLKNVEKIKARHIYDSIKALVEIYKDNDNISAKQLLIVLNNLERGE